MHAYIVPLLSFAGSLVFRAVDRRKLARADVHGVLTFYHDLRTTPPTEHIIALCVAEACQAVGSRDLELVVKEKFGDEVQNAYCFGNCALGPAVMVDGKLIGRANLEKISAARL